MINREKVIAILSLPVSTNAIPVAELAERSRVPLISTLSTHPDTTAGRHYVFRLTVLDSAQGRLIADFAFGELGARRAAVLANVSNPYSSGVGRFFAEAFESLGGRTTSFETYSEEGLDVTAQLQRIAAAGADVLCLPNLY